MQATQSNNASDFFESDSTGPHNIHSRDSHFVDGGISDLPSPFSAPIQAARRYLERQRGVALQKESGPATLAKGTQRDPVRELVAREQTTREQDRRLERSLYEGHSIEAGLSFEESHGFAESGRAYLAESDGAERLFPYADANPVSGQMPDPDSESVRGAIFRLTCESGTIKDLSKASLAPARIEAPADAQTSQSSVFADVARRVWGDHLDGKTPDALLSAQRGDVASARYPDSDRGDRGGTSDDRTGQLSPANATPSVNSLPRKTHTQAGAATLETGARCAPTFQVPEPKALASTVRSGSAFEDAALAHDACNLLSAVSLYSDLLNIPGVLAERHRHYAEELKLIAGRSQGLIDRMLGLGDSSRIGSPIGDTVALAGSAPEASTVVHQSDISLPNVNVEFSAGPKGRTASRGMLPTQPAQVHAGIHVTRRPVAVSTAEPAESAMSSDVDVPLVGGAHTITEAITANISTSVAGVAPATSLVDLLMRWGSLLSTLAHGTLDVCFGQQAATPVPMEAEPLERILVNLVRNARAATIAGGAIRIGVGVSEESRTEATGSGQAIVLTVDDSGCGMTVAQIDQILCVATGTDIGPGIAPGIATGLAAGQAMGPKANAAISPFRMPLDSSGRTEDKRRHGLGFQVVRDLVSASGGRLAIQSCPGRGTRVEIRWSVETASALAEEPVPIPIPISTPQSNVAIKVAAEAAPQPSLIELRPSLEPLPPVAVGPDGFSEAELRAMMLRLHRQGSTPPRFEATRSESGRLETDIYSAVKGAIAC